MRKCILNQGSSVTETNKNLREQGGMLRQKRLVFLTEIFVSEKNRPKNGDFTRFPRTFPTFCVLTLPPGGYIKTAKTEILEMKNFLSEKNRLKNGDFTRFHGKFPVFCVLTLPPGQYVCEFSAILIILL